MGGGGEGGILIYLRAQTYLQAFNAIQCGCLLPVMLEWHNRCLALYNLFIPLIDNFKF